MRRSYARLARIGTRWADSDAYGHVDNVVCHAFFDAAVIGLLVEAGCRDHAPIVFPDAVTAGVRVARIGRSRVCYAIGLFRGDAVEASAGGFFVHLYVDRATRRPAALPECLRTVPVGWTVAATRPSP